MADGDVLKISGGHQVFGTPSGGGGVTVTGSQGGSVAGATEFRAAGTVADLGSGIAGQGLVMTMLSADADVTMPDFVDPAEDNGPQLLTIPANSLFLAFAVQRTVFDESGFLLVSGGSQATVGDQVTLVAYSTAAQTPTAAVEVEPVPRNDGSVSELAANIAHWAHAKEECGVMACFFSSGTPPAAGAVTIYAIVATPAS